MATGYQLPSIERTPQYLAAAFAGLEPNPLDDVLLVTSNAALVKGIGLFVANVRVVAPLDVDRSRLQDVLDMPTLSFSDAERDVAESYERRVRPRHTPAAVSLAPHAFDVHLRKTNDFFDKAYLGLELERMQYDERTATRLLWDAHDRMSDGGLLMLLSCRPDLPTLCSGFMNDKKLSAAAQAAAPGSLYHRVYRCAR
jgi:hypothetical protein